jgi:hypothetical protein
MNFPGVAQIPRYQDQLNQFTLNYNMNVYFPPYSMFPFQSYNPLQSFQPFLNMNNNCHSLNRLDIFGQTQREKDVLMPTTKECTFIILDS